MRRLLPALLTVLSAGLLIPAPARAQQQEGPLRARLTEFTPWTEPEGSLRIGVSITNRGTQPAGDLAIGFVIYDAVGSRYDLAEALRGRELRARFRDTIPIDETIEPGATLFKPVEKAISEISFLKPTATKETSGTYPVQVTVSSGRTQAPPIFTQMVFFSRPAPERLQLSLVVPLHVAPVHDQRGRVVPAAQEAVFNDGRLDRILDAVVAHPDVPLTLAPSGLLLDTLAELAGGFVRVGPSGPEEVPPSDAVAQRAASLLERIRTVARRPNARMIVMPYSGAFLPGLVRAELADRAQAQIAESRARVVSHLGYEPLPGWVLPVGGLLDEPSLTALLRGGTDHAVIAEASVRRAAGASRLTPPAPVEVDTRAGRMPAAVVDDVLVSRLVPTPDLSPVQVRQRFLAETSAIMLEQPARRRAVAAATPLDWSPEPEVVEGILDSLARSPWVRGTTPDAVLAAAGKLSRAEPAEPEAILDRGPKLPADEYFESLRGARRRIGQYADLGPPPPMLAALDRMLLVAESAHWWSSRPATERGRSFARAVEETVRREFAKIKAPQAQTITLTSRSGTIPLVVASEASYDVKVVIRLDTDKLEFPGAQPCTVGPPGTGWCITRELGPRAQTVDIRTLARASGRFPLVVTLMTPSDGVVIDSSRIVVRSTAYNRVGVVITAGAAVFMVVWWAAGILRRRLPERAAA